MLLTPQQATRLPRAASADTSPSRRHRPTATTPPPHTGTCVLGFSPWGPNSAGSWSTPSCGPEAAFGGGCAATSPYAAPAADGGLCGMCTEYNAPRGAFPDLRPVHLPIYKFAQVDTHRDSPLNTQQQHPRSAMLSSGPPTDLVSGGRLAYASLHAPLLILQAGDGHCSEDHWAVSQP